MSSPTVTRLPPELTDCVVSEVRKFAKMVPKIPQISVDVSVGADHVKFTHKGYGYNNEGSLCHEREGKTLFGIGTQVELFVAVAFCIGLNKGQLVDMDWTSSAREVLNRYRGSRGKSEMAALTVDPSILNLFTHTSSFPDGETVRSLMAPDGTYLVSEDLFIKLLPVVINQTARPPVGTEYDHCRTNIIFAALILEAAMGLPFPKAMEELILKPLQLDHTVFDPEGLARTRERNSTVLDGYHIPVSGSTLQKHDPDRYLGDTVTVAGSGALSCTDDIATVLSEIRRARDGQSLWIRQADGERFMTAQFDCRPSYRPSLGGLVCPIDSSMAKSLSYMNQILEKGMEASKPGEQAEVCYSAGFRTGYACSYMISVDQDAHIVTLTNGISALDVTCHIPISILQKLLHDHFILFGERMVRKKGEMQASEILRPAKVERHL